MSDLEQLCLSLAASLHADYSRKSPCDSVTSALRMATSDIRSSRIIARGLHRLANENINTVPFHTVEEKWLQLYTDAAILETLAELSAEVSPTTCLAGIRRLDMATIVAGGLERSSMTAQLLHALQRRVPRSSREDPRPHKRARLEPPSQPLYAPSPIREIDEPSIETFITEASLEPFIVRGYATGDGACPHWRALDRWKSGAYLLDVAGPGRVVPVELGRAYDEEGWGQEIIPFDDFLDRAGFFESPAGAVYLAQYSLFRQIPELEKDIIIPDYAWSQPESVHPGYHPPPEPQLNVWVGSGSSRIVSPPHTDPFFNCYVQVVGHKRVWLAPPNVTPRMDGYSVESKEGSTAAKEYMGNTSGVPILKLEPEAIWAAHPQFKDKVYPHSQEAVLSPGDMLYMPPGWWHSMRGEGSGPGWSVSIWF